MQTGGRRRSGTSPSAPIVRSSTVPAQGARSWCACGCRRHSSRWPSRNHLQPPGQPRATPLRVVLRLVASTLLRFAARSASHLCPRTTREPSQGRPRLARVERLCPLTFAYGVRRISRVGYDDPKARVKVGQPAQVAVTGVPDPPRRQAPKPARRHRWHGQAGRLRRRPRAGSDACHPDRQHPGHHPVSRPRTGRRAARHRGRRRLFARRRVV